MSTVQLAMWAAKQIASQEWGPASDGDQYRQERTVYLGSVFSLDPCGRYHHMLSPNGYTNKCGQFWESLERQLNKRGMYLESGEGDPCDQYAGQIRDNEEDESLHEHTFVRRHDGLCFECGLHRDAEHPDFHIHGAR